MEVGYSCFDSFPPRDPLVGGWGVTNLQVGQEMLSEIVSSHNFDNAMNISKLFVLR